MSQRLFTAAEVDALIPKLTERMGEAMELHRRATALHEALELCLGLVDRLDADVGRRRGIAD